jgi:sulfatase maturation enzyme AslB (radical SAM superfamily)
MHTLQLVLTTACNLRCAYCYQDRKPRRFMDEDTLEAAMRLLLRSAGREAKLVLHGGEPLLAFPLVQRAVELAEAERSPRMRVRYETSTNGTLLGDERAAFLERHRVTTQVSFDGLPAAQDRRRPGSFALLDRRLRELRRARPSFFEDCVEVAITLTGANLPALADSVDYFVDRGVRTIHVSPRLPPDPDWTAASMAELRSQVARVCRSSRRLFDRTGRIPVSFLREERTRYPWTPPAMCTIGAGHALTVDVDGDVRGCTSCVASYQSFGTPGLREWIAPLRIGNVRAPDLAARVRAFQEVVRRTEVFGERAAKRCGRRRCARCPFLADCFVCPVAIAWIPGNLDPRLIPETHCAFNRVTLLHAGHFRRRPPFADELLGRVPDPPLVRELLEWCGPPRRPAGIGRGSPPAGPLPAHASGRAPA